MSGNRRSRRSSRSGSPRTGWDHLADWYDGWVGRDGSRYHQAVAIPSLLRLLDLGPGERLIDLGAGQGVLAPYVRRAGAEYVGVDASPRMVALARRRHGRDGRFEVGDAAALHAVRGVETGAFDAAAFLLSLQDMDGLDAILASAAAMLRPRSRIVLLLTHPAFRVPRHSGWGVDPGRGITYRRVDAYLDPMAVPLGGRPGTGARPSTTFHRPLSAYVNALAAVGFAVDALVELGDPFARDRNPAIPLFLGLRARRMAEPPRRRPARRHG